MEIQQRVVDLNKIDSKEMAYIAGYQCMVWWKETYNYQKRIDKLNQNIITVDCPFRKPFHEKWHEFIINNFKVVNDKIRKNEKLIDLWSKKGILYEDIINNDAFKKIFADYVIDLEITEMSKSFIGNKLPTCKKDLRPYLFLGFYHNSGNIYLNIDENGIAKSKICFVNSLQVLKTFKKQLIQWYDFSENDFGNKAIIKQLQNSKFYIFEISNVQKFLNIMPADYSEYFNVKSLF
ncbi:MAG: hypothetical protein [Wendovervirus sonii]|uniref:Uncharacterized protein n=1 Tax=phage Lak_Megaphage_Sonny TaxID=3109229 RepID=A0ABZ0Z5Z8_9CAUD|nr:MAG: hypothetical protein [phage Lak_Megaphage_Sonny]